jgi:dipeptidyl aminopeptidase/acylaminoacyl peptidase
MRLDGSGLAQLTSNAGANFYPNWSPDGSRLAFNSNRDGDWDIYVMNADGSQVRQLVNAPGLDDKPQWSPDGTRIGFATTRSGTPQLLAVDVATGQETSLVAQPVSGLNPAWSADGSRPAFNVVTSGVRHRGHDIRRSRPAVGTARRRVGGAATMVARWRPARLLLRLRRIVGRLRGHRRDRSDAFVDRRAWLRRPTRLATDSLAHSLATPA